MIKPLPNQSYRLEVSEKLELALKNYEEPIVIHKFNGNIHIFRIINDDGLYLFDKLHQGHDDIISEMIVYGEYLLTQRLAQQRKKLQASLTLVPTDKK